jgi:hypothetical protein
MSLSGPQWSADRTTARDARAREEILERNGAVRGPSRTSGTRPIRPGGPSEPGATPEKGGAAMTDCSPGEHPNQDRRNFRLEDYLAMCRAGEAAFSVAEAARVMGVSRASLYRWMWLASVPAAEFEAAVAHVMGRGLTSTTAVVDEIKRRTGKARVYSECCPHCGGVIRTRER